MSQNETPKEKQEEDEDDGTLTFNSFFFNFKLPKPLVDKMGPTFNQFILPVIAFAIGFLSMCYGLSQIIKAWRTQ